MNEKLWLVAKWLVSFKIGVPFATSVINDLSKVSKGFLVGNVSYN